MQLVESFISSPNLPSFQAKCDIYNVYCITIIRHFMPPYIGRNRRRYELRDKTELIVWRLVFSRRSALSDEGGESTQHVHRADDSARALALYSRWCRVHWKVEGNLLHSGSSSPAPKESGEAEGSVSVITAVKRRWRVYNTKRISTTNYATYQQRSSSFSTNKKGTFFKTLCPIIDVVLQHDLKI